jgi:hypothetical protein
MTDSSAISVEEGTAGDEDDGRPGKVQVWVFPELGHYLIGQHSDCEA